MRERLGRLGSSSRLQLVYNLEHDHGTETVELPFVIGVLAPLAGHATAKPLNQRKWKLIDRDNFDDVLRQLQPSLTINVHSGLDQSNAAQSVELSFSTLEDFDPPRLAERTSSVQHLTTARQSLSDLLERVESDSSLRQLVQELVSNDEAANSFLNSHRTPYDDDVLDRFRMQYRTPNRPATARLLDGLRALVALGPQADPMGLISDAEARLRLCERLAEGLVTAHLREILHHPEFQTLEATWRGLFHLVRFSETSSTLRIKVLALSKAELEADLNGLLEESALYRMILSDDRSGMTPEPIGMLLGDYFFDQTAPDLAVLNALASLSSRCHCPFLSNASSSLFDLANFRNLSEQSHWETPLGEGIKIQEWNRARSNTDWSHVALTVPRLLARKPWGENYYPCDGMNFEEFTGIADANRLPWMGAAWAHAVCLADAFCREGWFVRTVGIEGGGKIENLQRFTQSSNDDEPSRLWCAECLIGDAVEDRLGALGLLPIIQPRSYDFCVVYRSTSLVYVDPQSPDLQRSVLLSRWTYHLGVSRFAQVIRRIILDVRAEPSELTELLNQWLEAYCRPIGQDGAPGAHPLYTGQVKTPDGKPVLHLSIHWPADDSSTRTTVSVPVNLDEFA